MKLALFASTHLSLNTSLIVFFVVLAIAAIFVMSEFVLVRIRISRLDTLIENGNKNAILLKNMTQHLDSYLSATQLGVSITSLVLGSLGDTTFRMLFDPLFVRFPLSQSVTTVISVAVSFTVLTFVQVIIGELVPKNFAINKTEKIGLSIARPLQIWYKLMYPIVFVLNGTANIITRMFGMKSVNEDESVSEEEIRIIMSESLKSGEINHEEYQFVENVFEFDDRMSREIMIPRTEIAVVSIDMTLQEIGQLVKEQRYTRYPVIDGDKDNIIGVLNTKEIFAAYVEYVDSGLVSHFDMQEFIRPITSVIETIPIKEILLKMQKERNQISILVDEYGGTSGLISMEDIVEEIVGDIYDDYEVNELPEINQLAPHHYMVSARVLIDEINDLLGLKIDEENVDTIGGWMMNEQYDISEGEQIEYEGYIFTVQKAGKSSLDYIDIKQAPKKKVALSEPSEEVTE
ncbi:Hemolysin, contains CBS domains [Isobaculum melis]|uniref:Hemolysin, contains CBS domains n=1 Tax=Isobaculum melis TaxID=142588 RepID=A0A1H9QKA2_9LACT|nr:Hemolysin, contains CBS domains [Isobaculum melis]